MAAIRVTMIVRGLDGLKAKMAANTKAQKQRVLTVMLRSGERVFNDVVAHCPFDEGLMISATRLTYTQGGYHNAVGWYRRDFVGKRRPVTGTIVRFFYPVVIIRGSRRRAGNDILTAAELRERPTRRRELRRALGGR